jgi:phage tail-like protein
MPPPPRATSLDPFLSFRFEVSIGEQPVAGFSEVSGLDVESTVETFREGGRNEYEHQLVGLSKFPSRLVLKHGMTADMELWSWHLKIIQGQIIRKNVSIVLRDSAGARERTWKFLAAAPVKWVGPQFRAGGAEVVIETLELIHKGLAPK